MQEDDSGEERRGKRRPEEKGIATLREVSEVTSIEVPDHPAEFRRPSRKCAQRLTGWQARFYAGEPRLGHKTLKTEEMKDRSPQPALNRTESHAEPNIMVRSG